MKIQTRIISTLLAVLLMLSSLSVLFIFSASAALSADEKKVAEYYLKNNIFKTPQEKLGSMQLMMEKYDYQLYVDPQSGEIAMVEPATGNILFSNPYDVASSKGSDSIKTGGSAVGTKEELLLSQVIIQYRLKSNDSPKNLYSFADGAMRNQIEVSRIKSGVRVEYTIGREEFRKLVPRWIPAEEFENLILKPIREAIANGEPTFEPIDGEKPEENFYYSKLLAFYLKKDPDAPDVTAGEKELMFSNFPYTKEEGAMYVFSSTEASASDINMIEGWIKGFCPDYSFEKMDEDHETTGYEAEDDEYPVFKMALEYSLDENGLSVRMPCNGLQYNASSYTLENISILPYMGAGNTKNEGYNFYPDGAGALFDFDLNKTYQLNKKIYGLDYAYHDISGKYEKAIRVPVYGTVATETIYTYGYTKTTADKNGDPVVEEHPEIVVSSTVQSREDIEKLLAGEGITVTTPLTEKTYNRGYVAIIESGESLGSLETYFGGTLSDYGTVSNYFNPKPKDRYDIADSISVTSSKFQEIVSERKYTGNIIIRYEMLCDEKLGEAQKAQDPDYTYYDATWLGMAEAYRNYLVRKGTITRLTEEEVADDIPLYMEVFGALETQQTIATVPVDVMTPLTTFGDIYEMYEELSTAGVKNVNFKMTGFANGGMYSKIPASLKWEKAVGGKSGFEKLISQANDINAGTDGKNIGLYPDFDFAYCSENTLFDSLKLKDDAIRTIDNRYTSKRQYSATQQKFVSFYQLAISPSRYSKFYEKLIKNYDPYDLKTMSVSTLGNTLNSDFDEDEPYNREDTKEFTVKAFEDLKKANYSLMTDGGNAYTWKYLDHIINMDLDSSRYVKASASVPFLGAVLHGYIQFAGTPLNEEGDTDYAILKAIENGAGMYFILSYQNTQELKEDENLSQYYSINYDIWKQDVISYYNELNAQLKDLQTKLIVDHKFLNYNSTDINGNAYLTERVLDPDELEQDILEELKKAEEQAKEEEKNQLINAVANAAEAYIAIQKNTVVIEQLFDDIKALKAELVALKDLDATGISKTSAQSDVDALRTEIVDAWKVYAEIEYLTGLAKDGYAYLLEQYDLIEKGNLNNSTLPETVAAKLAALREKYAEMGFVTLDGEKNITAWTTEQIKTMAWYDAALTGTVEEFFTPAITAVSDAVAAANAAGATDIPEFIALSFDLDLELLKTEGAYTPVAGEQPDWVDDGTSDDTQDADNTNTGSKYQVTNNSVVAVSYGNDKQDPNKTTFILNYNNFAVRVTYNGVVYTVPSNGYVVVKN